MKDKLLYYLWGGWYIVCALLGFIPQPEGFVRVLLVLAALAFFVPGGILLYRAVRDQNVGRLRLIRNLSLIWLATAFLLLVLNFLSFYAGEATGDALYGFMILLTAPMVCGQYYVLSLFLWAVFLMTSLSFLRKIRKNDR